MHDFTPKKQTFLTKLLNTIPQSEKQLQNKCAQLLYWFYPEHWRRFVCVNNNDRHANTQGLGIVPGASDTYWIAENGCTLYLEFKFGPNAIQSTDQKVFEEICNRYGHKYYIVDSEDDFWNYIQLKKPDEKTFSPY